MAASPTQRRASRGVPAAPSPIAPVCVECWTPIGNEAYRAILHDDPVIGFGFLHDRVCADEWYGTHLLDPSPWRLVKVV